MTVGATLAMVTAWLAEPVPPSPSSAETEMVGLAGPSAKMHLKLEPVSEPAT